MKEIASAIQYKPLRAPNRDGEALFEPARNQAEAEFERNRALHKQWHLCLNGRSISDLQAAARSHLIQEARNYTAEYRDLPTRSEEAECQLILAGHQPDLVHPGVWFKNFVLSDLAAEMSAVPVNLLIDNDIVRSTAVRLPTGSTESPRLTTILMDRSDSEVPFEERVILDIDLFRSCGQRTHEALQPLVPNSLVMDFWSLAAEASRSVSNLGYCIARARHTLEESIGLHSLELPLSTVCHGRPFRWFALNLFSNAAKFRSVHNQCLHEFRRVNRVRSRSHPVPELGVEDDWIEVPFWIWQEGDPRRRRAFVRFLDHAAELTDRNDVRITLALDADGDLTDAVDQLGQLDKSCVRIRPRALITTMFARMVLSDLFIHGIGGAKYDQLTDAIIDRFFELEPPAYLVVSATFRLPIPHASFAVSDLARINRTLREFQYHPESHVTATPATKPWIEEKGRLIGDASSFAHGRERHQRIERANRKLQPFLQAQYDQLVQQRAALQAGMRSAAILESREYPFCLFPKENLIPRLKNLARLSS